MLEPLAIFRALATLAAAVIVGSSILLSSVILRYSPDDHLPAGATIWRHRVVVAVLVSSIVGVAATCVNVVGTAAGAAGISLFFINGAVISTFLKETGVGQIAIIEIACAMAACVPAAIAWATLKKAAVSEIALLWAAFFAALGLVVYPFNSHPVILQQVTAGLLSSIGHRLAFAVWLGGLPALILLIGAGPVADDTRKLVVVALRRFSRLATVAIIVILATGSLLTWFFVPNFPSLIGTQYGYLLIIKLALLGGVLGIAQGLQRKLLPVLKLRPGDSIIRTYARRVKFETCLAFLIVLVASDMAGLPPPEHEDIYWPLPFRFSLAATWPVPWVPTRTISGAVLILAGCMLVAGRFLPFKPAWYRLSTNASLGAGAAAVLAGGALAFPAISVRACPDTYLSADVPFSATSVAAGLRHYETNCAACHGTSGHGDGPLAPSMPPNQQPADLSAPRTALRTSGDLYWLVSHGIEATPMPGFGKALTSEERWDIINFLEAFAGGYETRAIEPKVFPGKYWLGPPDFQVTDESGRVKLLSDYQRKSALLLVLLTCSEQSFEEDHARLEQLLAAREGLAGAGAKIILVAPGKICQPLCNLARGKTLIADDDTEDVAATYRLFTRSFPDGTMDVRVPPSHAEFLIDRSGYIRARWLPKDGNSRSHPGFIATQLNVLRRERLHSPPPDIHSQH